MSAPRNAENKAKGGTRQLSLAKRTLKDLSVRHAGPKGGFITKNTIVSSPSTSAQSGTSARWY
jgi:hypothetical protein